MHIIRDFVARYRREYDFFSEAARLISQQLESRLQATGIRSIVTYRAKRPDRLEEKLIKRSKTRPDGYQSVDSIYDDIIDLAGVRVALYFPADREKVGNLIQSTFRVTREPKVFPDLTTAHPEFTSVTEEKYKKKFTGYWATHFLVQLVEGSLSDPQKRYAEARVEIQVASVLMHAWSEVEHDLIYKPMQGPLSIEEYAILDEINGMVQSGEIALEQLQRAAEMRVARHDNPFSNHYDLAAYLFEKTKPMRVTEEPIMGRVDVLFDLLQELDIATPDGISNYIESLKSQTERRPIADQIIDEIIAADRARYEVFSRIRLQREGKSPYKTVSEDHDSSEQEKAIGYFMSQWIAFERVFREVGRRRGYDEREMISPNSRVLRRLNFLNDRTVGELEHLRRIRNNLVHGVEIPDAEFIMEAGNKLKHILSHINSESLSGDDQNADGEPSGELRGTT
jgi:ppGpp synthetase/RelA/SpoT-type nucleotidyltranferase